MRHPTKWFVPGASAFHWHSARGIDDGLPRSYRYTGIATHKEIAVPVTYRPDSLDLDDARVARCDTTWTRRCAEIDARIERSVAELAAELRDEMQVLKSDLVKWMFAFWTVTTMATLLFR